ncbi:unnamed protein product [Effrenium voratum]|nr:unnamed protein product [Effrenium voratum]
MAVAKRAKRNAFCNPTISSPSDGTLFSVRVCLELRPSVDSYQPFPADAFVMLSLIMKQMLQRRLSLRPVGQSDDDAPMPRAAAGGDSSQVVAQACQTMRPRSLP